MTSGKPPVSQVTFWCESKGQGNRGDAYDKKSTVNGLTAVTSSVTLNILTLADNGTRCLCNAAAVVRVLLVSLATFNFDSISEAPE